MSHPPASPRFVYVHTDIPPGMTIREWRARTPDGATSKRPRLALRIRVAALRAWSAAARAFAWPRIVRVRTRGAASR
jgi:hypothetical protein